MRCQFCGTDNVGDALYCENCGKPLPRAERPACILCPRCGGKNPPDSKFCESCGGSLEADESRAQGAGDWTDREEYRRTPRESVSRRGYRDPRERAVEDFYDPDPSDSDSRGRGLLIAGIVAALLILAGGGIFLGSRFLAGRNSDTEAGNEVLDEKDGDSPNTLTQTEQKEESTQTETQQSETQQPQTQQSETQQPQTQQSETQQPQTQQSETQQPQTQAPVEGESGFYNDGRVVAYGSYILPDSSTRYITDEELNSMTLKGLCYAKNELYARYGRKFNSSELSSYFSRQSWYQPTYEPTPENDSMIVSWMNEYELHNMEALSNKEAALGTYDLQ